MCCIFPLKAQRVFGFAAEDKDKMSMHKEYMFLNKVHLQ